MELYKQPLQPAKIREMLVDSSFVRNILFYETIGSTNAEAKFLAVNGAPEGVIVLAEEQNLGRGRMGRHWLSEGYVNLLLSVLVRPHLHAEEAFALTMAFALATANAIEAVCDLRALIKWPNDLYLSGKKLGGILTEVSISGVTVEYMILGLGLNVNWRPVDDVSLLYQTTSLCEEAKGWVDRDNLLVKIFNEFDSYYKNGVLTGIDTIHEAWNLRSMLFNKTVEIEMTGASIRGKAKRIDRKGALIILDDSGEEHRILNGDVSVTSPI